MNNLSWLLYLADVLGNFKVLLICLIAAGVILTAIRTLVWGSQMEDAKYKEVKPRFPSLAVFGLIFITVVVSLLAVATPSASTVYAIAASQFGEQVIKTPLATKAEKALESWLDRQIAVPAKKSSD